MIHTKPRQPAAYGEPSPTPEGKISFPGFKKLHAIRREKGKKAVPGMMSLFPLLHKESMSPSYFKDDILVLIFLSVLCV